MPVTETLQGMGEWTITLSPNTPQKIIDGLMYFGHVAVDTGLSAPDAGDPLLRSSRYVGVLRGIKKAGNDVVLTGAGMAFWLGDEEGKGYAIEEPLVVNGLFNVVVPALLPPSVQPGTIYNVAKTFNDTFQYIGRREALNYLCDTLECAWRINGDGTVDAGLESDLFTVVPEAALIRSRDATDDLFLRAFAGAMSTEQDVKDFTTRTVLLANGSEGSTVTATADILPAKNPFKDLFGNSVTLTRFISESDTNADNAPARAQLQLNRFTNARNAITLSTADHLLKGTADVGDYLWVYDPEVGVEDPVNEVYFRGDLLYPMRLRLTERTWPVTRDMLVGYRHHDGTWIDLTPYVQYETGDTTLVVGGYNRSLVGGDGGTGGSRPIQDTSVPGVPTWTTPFVQSVYQSDSGESRAQVQLVWTRPENVDGSTILDGDHFEIRYRSATTPIYPSTHAQMSLHTHAELHAGTHAQPLTYPEGPWQTLFVPWSDLDALVIDLATNLPYEAQIRAVDAAKPPNAGDWSAVVQWQTNRDTLPPATPAPPVVAASRLAVMVKHYLGRASGGTFNLDADLHHLEVHGAYEPLFTPDDTTLLGKIQANVGMITGQVPLVGTVPIESVNPVYFKVIAVDNDGNASLPSSAVQATALLVDNMHISDLEVGKVTAGTISANWLLGASIRTGVTGARVELNSGGLVAYNASNVQTVRISSTTGAAMFSVQDAGAGLEVISSGVQKLYIGTDQTRVRDRSGNVIYSDDVVAGWGMTQPNLQTAFFPITIAAPAQTNTADGKWYAKWVSGHIINHSRVKCGFYMVVSGPFGGARFRWYTGWPGTNADPSGGTWMGEVSQAGPSANFGHFTYDWPSNMFGQLVYVSVEVMMSGAAGGADWVGANPMYFYGTGR